MLVIFLIFHTLRFKILVCVQNFIYNVFPKIPFYRLTTKVKVITKTQKNEKYLFLENNAYLFVRICGTVCARTSS